MPAAAFADAGVLRTGTPEGTGAADNEFSRPQRLFIGRGGQYFFLQIVNLCVTLRDKAP